MIELIASLALSSGPAQPMQLRLPDPPGSWIMTATSLDGSATRFGAWKSEAECKADITKVQKMYQVTNVECRPEEDKYLQHPLPGQPSDPVEQNPTPPK